jgi:glucokinase
MEDHLIAAIDGAAVSFAIARRNGTISLSHIWEGQTADFSTFTDALQSYLKSCGLGQARYPFALAVAGIPRGDVIQLANCRWFISASGLRSYLQTEPLIINDFAATAWSLTALKTSAFVSIGATRRRELAPGGTYLIVGTGSGLGLSVLHLTPEGEVVIMDSEGGHSSYSPQTEQDDKILAILRSRFGHVSFERLVSYAGIENIYSALGELAGEATPPPAGKAIVEAAATMKDPRGRESVRIFARALGSFAGNATLTAGAWDGVFLTGEMLLQLSTALRAGEFEASFSAKGRLSKPLQSVPLALVDFQHTGLLGAAAASLRRNGAAPAPAPAAERGQRF